MVVVGFLLTAVHGDTLFGIRVEIVELWTFEL
jgi:hypothetical protein